MDLAKFFQKKPKALDTGAGADGSASKTTNPNGDSSFSLRDGAGRSVASVDALGHISRAVYDAYGRVVQSIDGAGKVARVWHNVKVKGHAAEVLEAVKGL